MYTVTNYKSKKAMVEDVKAGKKVRVYQPGPFPGSGKTAGAVSLEGPHYPEPHRWYARVLVKDSIIVKVVRD